VARWFDRPTGTHAGEHHGHIHDGVRSLTLTAEAPLDWAAFGLWLSMLLNRHGDRILRVKGLLNVAGASEPVVIHGVQHMIHKPVHLDTWPEGDSRTRLVVIATGLDLGAVERSFRAFLHPLHSRSRAETSAA
jgi:G3E family GTPase